MSYVVLLRGINLGQKNKVDMKSLKALFEKMGFENVSTYIQTGNVIVNHIVCAEQRIESTLKQAYGFEIPVTIRSKEELEAVQQHDLFTKDNVYVMFLKNLLTSEQLTNLEKMVDDDFTVVNENTIIINLSKSYHQTKYTNTFFEKKLQMPSTARNKNTVNKILLKMET